MVLLSVVERGGGGEGVVAIQDMKPTVLISPWHTISVYFIHLSKRQTSSVSYMPGAILSAGNTTVKRTDKKPSLRDLAIQTSARDPQGEVLWGQERGPAKGTQTASPFLCSQHPWHGTSQDADARTLPVSFLYPGPLASYVITSLCWWNWCSQTSPSKADILPRFCFATCALFMRCLQVYLSHEQESQL